MLSGLKFKTIAHR